MPTSKAETYSARPRVHYCYFAPAYKLSPLPWAQPHNRGLLATPSILATALALALALVLALALEMALIGHVPVVSSRNRRKKTFVAALTDADASRR